LPAVHHERFPVQVLAAGPQVMAPLCRKRKRKVVAQGVDRLVEVTRMILVSRNQEADEREPRRAGCNPVGLLPMIRPVGEIRVGESERGLADLDLVQGTVAEDLRQVSEVLVVILARVVRCTLPIKRICAESW
jgi:hypothetical protein